MILRPLKVVVVDDEIAARRRLVRFVKSEPGVDRVVACGSGSEAVEVVRSTHPDIIFLDVKMPEIDAFELLDMIPPAERPLVVFVTAFAEHAVRAFEVHAIDYLLKPFGPERFAQAFSRARDEVQLREEHQRRLARVLDDAGRATVAPPGAYLDRLMIKTAGMVFFLKVHELDWIEAADNYVRLHRGKDVHLIRETLSGLAARLDPGQFARIHRSAVVNLDRVKEMHQAVSRGYVAVLQNGTRLKVSPWYRERLEARMRPRP